MNLIGDTDRKHYSELSSYCNVYFYSLISYKAGDMFSPASISY